MNDFRVERMPAGASPPATLAALAASVEGGIDGDPLPDSCERWLAWRGDEPLAHLSAMLASELSGAPGVSGLVGHYAAADPGAGIALLVAACAAMTGRGALRVLGPMNGNTWHRYRLALPPEPGDPLPPAAWFLGEPRNPPGYLSQFEAAGFKPVAYYESRIESPIRIDEAARQAATQRLASRGINVRALAIDRFEGELRECWELSLESFAENAWYSPIPFEEFLAMYRPLRTLIEPELVLLAHDGSGRLVGFMLGMIDGPREACARAPRLVCKTLAVARAARGLGLGGLLLSEVRARGLERGCTAAIDALMHVSNASLHISQGHGSRVMRRYALHEWTP